MRTEDEDEKTGKWRELALDSEGMGEGWIDRRTTNTFISPLTAYMRGKERCRRERTKTNRAQETNARKRHKQPSEGRSCRQPYLDKQRKRRQRGGRMERREKEMKNTKFIHNCIHYHDYTFRTTEQGKTEDIHPDKQA